MASPYSTSIVSIHAPVKGATALVYVSSYIAERTMQSSMKVYLCETFRHFKYGIKQPFPARTSRSIDEA